MSIRPMPAGQNSKVTWGVLGKRRTYVNAAYKAVPNLTNEERMREIERKMKPYNSGDYIQRSIFVVGGASEAQPTPEPQPPFTSNLALWWDAADTDTITLVGSDVDSWSSKGYLTPTLTAPTADRRPTYITDGGEGSTPAVKFKYNVTSALRSVLVNKASGVSISGDEFTAFVIGKTASPGPTTGAGWSTSRSFNLWDSTYTTVNGSVYTYLTNNGATSSIPQSTGTTAGKAINLTFNYSNNGMVQASPYFYTANAFDRTDLKPTTNVEGEGIFGGLVNSSATSSSAYTESFTGITYDSFGMFGYQISTTYIPTIFNDTEQYEVLVYDYKMTASEREQVKTYLYNKWNPVVNLTGLGVITDSEWVGITGTTTTINYAELEMKNIADNRLKWFGSWSHDITGPIPLLTSETLGMYTTLPNGTAANFWIKDSGGNYVLNEVDYYTGSTGYPLTWTPSADTYTFSGSVNYNFTPFDSDAAAYLADVITAGGSVDSTMSAATNTLFTDLKSNGLYSKIKAFYPVLGGISNSHAINGNGNASYDLTFNGTFTHSYSGFVGTTDTSYASTNYIPLTEHSGGTMTMGLFENAKGVNGNDRYMMGAYNSGTRFLSWDYQDIGAPNVYYTPKYLNNSLTGRIQVSATTNFYGFVQLGSDGTNKYLSVNRDGVEYTASAAKDGGTLPDVEIYISNLNVNNTTYTNQRGRVCFAYMGDYLTSAEMTTMGNIVNAYQTALGRNTY